MEQQTAETVKQIKQSFRLFMNGSASRSMRDKGLEYKINWGVPLPQLREMAATYGKNHDLAVALWHEPIRECKIMATMIVPIEQVTKTVAEDWSNGIATTELAEIASFNLFRHLDFAISLSLEWLFRDDKVHRLCAYHILNRRLQSGFLPDESAAMVIIKHLRENLKSADLVLKHAAVNCLSRLCDTAESLDKQAKEALTQLDSDFFMM